MENKSFILRNKLFVLTVLALLTLSVYLFTNAPQPLAEKNGESQKIPVNVLLNIVSSENAAVRALYSKEIVGSGKEVGLKFSEDWQENDVDAGPLPALLLREVSKNLEKTDAHLSLFLGSDFPIASSNKFKGIQVNKFTNIKNTLKPEYFYSADIKRYTAMYPDFATTNTCVECHNSHVNSPKKDWKLHDVMGATTWLYPNEYVSPEEIMVSIKAIRHSFRVAYQAYLDKVKTFKEPPVIGDKWPRDGYFIPSVDVFMQEVELRASTSTVNGLIGAVSSNSKPE